MGRVEFEHWRSADANASDMPAVFADSVAPVFDAGLVDLVETDHRICDEISLVPTLGHTPGHVSVRIASRGEEALITGDFIHHPCQIARPEWSSTADNDPQRAERTRARRCSRGSPARRCWSSARISPAPTAGRVVRDGDAFRLV